MGRHARGTNTTQCETGGDGGLGPRTPQRRTHAGQGLVIPSGSHRDPARPRHVVQYTDPYQPSYHFSNTLPSPTCLLQSSIGNFDHMPNPAIVVWFQVQQYHTTPDMPEPKTCATALPRASITCQYPTSLSIGIDMPTDRRTVVGCMSPNHDIRAGVMVW